MYQLANEEGTTVNLIGSWQGIHPQHRFWKDYLVWLEEGNTVMPYGTDWVWDEGTKQFYKEVKC